MDHPIPEKRCTMCGEVKPHTDFHVASKKFDGLCSSCKVCRKAKYTDKYSAQQKARAEARSTGATPLVIDPTELRRCSVCGEEKPTAMFGLDRRRECGVRSYCLACGRDSNSAFYQKNPEEMRQRARDYRAANPDKRAAYGAKYRAENPEKVKAAAQAWRAANPDAVAVSRGKYRTKHAEAIKEKKRRYYAANKATVDAGIQAWRAANRPLVKALSLFHTRARQARKIKAVPGWADPAAIKTVYDKAQVLSGILGCQISVDHVVPLTSDKVCGLHTWENLQLMALELNVSKGNRYWPDMP